ncbi:DsbA family oxidoreductase [Montanilutibacter psychrotolerans]|uniref:DsbA family oxidoreductase n=1 Tax=Montanilutibacter psychrotolerans TaxID=1327343 RepID=A0A3M8T1J7_9GAMM|nr:DsbA family oxidoreductase [Lysobacter psychrotolerans]RNF84980.1 DsbA family oxidoreductase [Lysobacter psychrotolerans]
MRIDIWSDLVCPWCWIGKHRLQAALDQLGQAGTSVDIHWHAFQLDPDSDETPVPLREAYVRKFGGIERTEQILASTQATGRAEGLPFDFDRGQVRVNTLKAHRLVWLAGREGDAGAVGEALFRAHFAHGRNLADTQVLVEAGIAGGLDEARVRAMLASDEGIAEVQAQLGQARALGITAVPTFIIDGRVGVQGGQPPQAFLEIFAKLGLTVPAIDAAQAASGDACGPTGCAV